MSGLLHPVGPEPAQTYWLRRALVLGAFAVVLAIFIALVANATGGAQVVSAVPPSPAGAVTPLTSPSPSSTQTSASAKPSATPSPAATSKASSSTTAPTAAATPKASRTGKASTAPKASTTPNPSAKKAPALCDPGQLRTTLTGTKRLATEQATVFELSLINGGPSRCLATVSSGNFVLKIYSGSDRIWSSNDCAVLKPLKKQLGSQQQVAWKMGWNGQRSTPGCQKVKAVPRAGTYIATAQLKGAKAVKVGLNLHG
jgi:hypothetical protein